MFDFAPGAWLDAHPVPPPRGRARVAMPWRAGWAVGELERGREAAIEIVRLVGQQTGRGADATRSLWAWAVTGMEAAYVAKDGDGLRQHVSVLVCVLSNLPDALTWFPEVSNEKTFAPAKAVPARARRTPRHKALDEFERNGPGASALLPMRGGELPRDAAAVGPGPADVDLGDLFAVWGQSAV